MKYIIKPISLFLLIYSGILIAQEKTKLTESYVSHQRDNTRKNHIEKKEKSNSLLSCSFGCIKEISPKNILMYGIFSQRKESAPLELLMNTGMNFSFLGLKQNLGIEFWLAPDANNTKSFAWPLVAYKSVFYKLRFFSWRDCISIGAKLNVGLINKDYFQQRYTATPLSRRYAYPLGEFMKDPKGNINNFVNAINNEAIRNIYQKVKGEHTSFYTARTCIRYLNNQMVNMDLLEQDIDNTLIYRLCAFFGIRISEYCTVEIEGGCNIFLSKNSEVFKNFFKENKMDILLASASFLDLFSFMGIFYTINLKFDSFE